MNPKRRPRSLSGAGAGAALRAQVVRGTADVLQSAKQETVANGHVDVWFSAGAAIRSGIVPVCI